MKKLLQIIIAAMMLAMMMPTIMAAPAFAQSSVCIDDENFIDPADNRFAGMHIDGGTYSVRSVKAWIVAHNGHFKPCGSFASEVGGPDGPSAWVAIVPVAFDPYDIMQIGIINCRDSDYAACDGSNQLHWFWDYAGCNGYEPTPVNIGLVGGTGGFSGYTYKIEFFNDTTDYYEFSIWGAGAQYPSFLSDVLVTNAKISCWAQTTQGRTYGMTMGETQDGGDSLGTATGSELSFTSVQYQYASDGYYYWHNAYWDANTACLHADDSSVIDTHCDKTSVNSLLDWSIEK